MDFDFLIIGGGIAGTSAGAALCTLGKTGIWEAETALAYHASGRSAALFEQSYGTDAVIALNRASAEAHFEGKYTSDRGLMFVGGHDSAEVLTNDIAKMGLDALSPIQAAEMLPILNPDAIVGAGYHADAYDLDTDRMVHDAARLVRASGGSVETGREVTAVSKVKGGWEIHATDRMVTARVLVNAAGAWADPLASMAGVDPIGVTPLRRSMARLAAPNGLDTRGWPMVIGAGEAWYAKPDAGALLVSPAEEDPCTPMDAYADDMVLAEGLARYQEVVTPAVTRPIATWAGLRSFSPDRNLVLGPAPQDASFVWCVGQGGYGFQTAPAASRLLADRVAGRPSELPQEIVDALIPERFL